MDKCSRGLVVDGRHGDWQADRQVVAMARDLGWDCFTRETWWLMPTEPEATGWLNENHAEDGCHYGWHEGDFFYLSDDEWEVMA